MAGTALTVISILGGRASIARRHIEACMHSALNSHACRFVFCVTHPTNSVLQEIARKSSGGFCSAEVVLKDFDQSCYPSGFDHDYDTLLSRYVDETGAFLCLHDDTIIDSRVCVESITDLLSGCHFAGYRDHNYDMVDYRDIMIDGRPLGDIRLGTWFLCGRKPLPTEIGCGRFFRKIQVEELGPPGRIVVNKPLVWMNGGCLLNIKARLEGAICQLIDHDAFPYATHVEAGTWDLVKTGLLCYNNYDKENEAELAILTFSDFDEERKEQCVNYLRRIVNRYATAGIHDAVISHDFLRELQVVSGASLRQVRSHEPPSTGCRISEKRNMAPRPSHIQIQTVQRCAQSESNKLLGDMAASKMGVIREMPMELFTTITSSLREIGARHVTIGLWDDPLLDSRIWERFALLRTLLPSTKLQLATNAKTITPEMGNRLCSVPVDTLQLLLPINGAAASTDVYDDSYGTLNQLRRVQELISSAGGQTHIQLVIQSEKKADDEPCTRYWMAQGFDCIHVDDATGKSAFLRRSDRRVHMFVYGCELRRHLDWLHIGIDGDIWLCPNDTHQDCFLGSVVDQSVEEIVSGNSRVTYRYRIETGGPDRLPCHFCTFGRTDIV